MAIDHIPNFFNMRVITRNISSYEEVNWVWYFILICRPICRFSSRYVLHFICLVALKAVVINLDPQGVYLVLKSPPTMNLYPKLLRESKYSRLRPYPRGQYAAETYYVSVWCITDSFIMIALHPLVALSGSIAWYTSDPLNFINESLLKWVWDIIQIYFFSISRITSCWYS